MGNLVRNFRMAKFYASPSYIFFEVNIDFVIYVLGLTPRFMEISRKRPSMVTRIYTGASPFFNSFFLLIKKRTLKVDFLCCMSNKHLGFNISFFDKMRKSCATTPESKPCIQSVGHFWQGIKSNGQSNAKRRILPDSALCLKRKESRKSLIFRILPRIAFVCCGPTWA